MRLKKFLIDCSVLLASVLLTLGICETAARLILRPADYLSVEMVRDPILGAFPSTSAQGHGFDAWGFRNSAVPKSADIVAIGDSHTYGNTARMEDSWPYVLGRLTGRSVYNLGLGGYGPNQYFHLLSKGLSLKPRIIICGLYMGDDFENAFLITYGLDHWAYLRQLPAERIDADRANIWEEPPSPTWHKKIRLWLSRHSVVYQLVVHGPILGGFSGKIQIRDAHRANPSATALFVPARHIEEAFLPKEILRRLDQNSESVREGMRITFSLLQQMNETCRQNQVTFMVVVIPTKEMVFSQYLEHNSAVPLDDVIDRLYINERQAREETFSFLGSSGIPYVDPLPSLMKSVGNELYVRSAGDMHPSKNGYHVIAEAIFETLKNEEKKKELQPASVQGVFSPIHSPVQIQ